MSSKRQSLSHILQSSKSNAKFLLIISGVIAILMVDIVISTVIDFFQPQISASSGVALFALVGLAFAAGQFFILRSVKQKTKSIKSKTAYLRALDVSVTAVQYALVAVFVVTILQMAFSAGYSSAMLTATTTLSYTLSIVLLGVLSYRFLSWYKANRNLFVLLYVAAAVANTLSGIFAMAFFDSILMAKPPVIAAQTMPAVAFDPASAVGAVQTAFKYSAIASFALLWIGSALLIRQYYSQRLGRNKYWLIASAPLVYSIVYFVTEPLFTMAASDQTLMFYYFILFSFWNIAGGAIFGAAFLRVARSIKQGAVKDYMTIAGCGLILLFVSGSATVIHNPYPPFGLATISFVGLSSYMLLLGLYSSAISVSQDARLRLSIRKSAYEESTLLDRIGAAEMEQELQKKVAETAKNNSERMKEQSGVEPSITEEEVKNYLDLITKEIEDRRVFTGKSKSDSAAA